ncbi:pyridoxal-phosphate dependent enzyme [Nocardioides sp. LHG3406-4]|uniref:pyridoxal-phosphate dependent enzyme n=1 Tax=Nocardioides sp. LHG3406-4 TaxID=2804575 RepID=UPI003CF4C64F
MNKTLASSTQAPIALWSPGAPAPAGGLARWTPNVFRDASDARRTFHRSLPGYAVTPLIDLPDLAADLGLTRLVVKDESSRLGLPAFKMLGASWAVYRSLAALCEETPEPTLEALREKVVELGPMTLVTATDGNHGRAVARMATYLGLSSLVLIPSAVSNEAIDLVRSEGADVEVLDLSYDETVAEAARRSEARSDGVRLLVQDTSWPGYETVPTWIVDGYGTLFDEATAQLNGDPALVVVPAGVGSLAHAAVLHCRSHPGWRAVTVEPEVAPCIAASLAAGAAVSTGTGETSMAGLNCGTPSSLAFPDLLSTLDGALWVTDGEAEEASASLAGHGIDAGACGAASLAALRQLCASEGGDRLLSDLTVLLLNTEASR